MLLLCASSADGLDSKHSTSKQQSSVGGLGKNLPLRKGVGRVGVVGQDRDVETDPPQHLCWDRADCGGPLGLKWRLQTMVTGMEGVCQCQTKHNRTCVQQQISPMLPLSITKRDKHLKVEMDTFDEKGETRGKEEGG